MAKKPDVQADSELDGVSVSMGSEPAPDDYPLTLNEFCQRLSVTDKRVTLIGGFEMHMRLEGRMKDTEANFRSAYTDFANHPVEG